MTDPGEEHFDSAELTRKLELVRRRIAAAGGSDRVKVLGVTKRKPVAAVRAALDIGLFDIGENYAQELAAKDDELADERVRWHFIGGLQRNKVKLLAGRVHTWQTIDRPALAHTLASREPGARLFVQANTTDEAQKSGCALDDVPRLVAECQELGLQVAGLMTVGPTDPDADPRPGFAALRSLAERLDLPELSMGMTRDLEAAVEEGSTMVRIGTDLFGRRD